MNIEDLKALKEILSKETLSEEDVNIIRQILSPIISEGEAMNKSNNELLKKKQLFDVEIAKLQEKKSRLERDCIAIEEKLKDSLMYLRKREVSMDKRTSDIDLREENKRTRTPNSSDKPLEEIAKEIFVSTSSNSYLQDYIIIIKAMFELGMFTKFDPTIHTAEDLAKQKKATLAMVMDAFGKAVNIPDLSKSYNPLLQKAKNESYEYDLTIFDSLKAIAEHRLNNKP